ncbi:Clp protease N-terminal domain-containing protein, partial [Bacteriovoracaceae bacterium]|nr:Clp protease N-terminal domain-containing protein [Bacteriovoracaceae bacterium]
MKNFDSIVTGAIEIAQTEALNRKHPEIYPEHLVLGLIRNPQSYCSRALKKEAKNLEKLLGELPTVKGDINL